MLDYDREAPGYDESRGGPERAAEAAAAVERLLPRSTGSVVDVAGGTAIVARVLHDLGRDVFVCDLSEGMLRRAHRRLPGRVFLSDAGRLPLPDGGVSAVYMIWLLHLADDVEMILAEAMRVLAPGGRLLTTVDKAAAHGHHRGAATDASVRVESILTRLGAVPAQETTFVGLGQGRGGSPDPVFALRAFAKAAAR